MKYKLSELKQLVKSELHKNNLSILNEITLAQAGGILQSKATKKQLSGLLFNYYGDLLKNNPEHAERFAHLNDEEKKQLIKNEIDRKIDQFHNQFITLIKGLIPADIAESDQALSAIWLKNELLKKKYQDQICVMVRNAEKDPEWLNIEASQTAGDIERKWGFRNKIERFFQFKDFIKPDIKKDINRVNGLEDLTAVVNAAREGYAVWKRAQAYVGAEEGSELIYDTAPYKIYIPHNKAAACKLGEGTDWCTADPERDYYSKYHKKDDPLFIIYRSEGDSVSRFQFHYGSSQFMNDKDQQIGDFPYGRKLFNDVHEILRNTVGERFPFLMQSQKVEDKYVKPDIEMGISWISFAITGNKIPVTKSIRYKDILTNLVITLQSLPDFYVEEKNDSIHYSFKFIRLDNRGFDFSCYIRIIKYKKYSSLYKIYDKNSNFIKFKDAIKNIGKVVLYDITWMRGNDLVCRLDEDGELSIDIFDVYKDIAKNQLDAAQTNPEKFAIDILEKYLPADNKQNFFPDGIKSETPIYDQKLQENKYVIKVKLLK